MSVPLLLTYEIVTWAQLLNWVNAIDEQLGFSSFMRIGASDWRSILTLLTSITTGRVILIRCIRSTLIAAHSFHATTITLSEIHLGSPPIPLLSVTIAQDFRFPDLLIGYSRESNAIRVARIGFNETTEPFTQ